MCLKLCACHLIADTDRARCLSMRSSQLYVRNRMLTDSSSGMQHGVLPQHDIGLIETHPVCDIQIVFVTYKELWQVTRAVETVLVLLRRGSSSERRL